MDLDSETLKIQIDNLTHQAEMDRWQTSRAIRDIVDFVEQNEFSDPIIHPLDKKNSPWIDQARCIVF